MTTKTDAIFADLAAKIAEENKKDPMMAGIATAALIVLQQVVDDIHRIANAIEKIHKDMD